MLQLCIHYLRSKLVFGSWAGKVRITVITVTQFRIAICPSYLLIQISGKALAMAV